MKNVHLFDYAVENIADPKGRGLLYCFLRCTLLTGRAASNLIHRDCAGILAGTACGAVPALAAGRNVNSLALLGGGLFLRCLLSCCGFGGCLFLRSLLSGCLFGCLLFGLCLGFGFGGGLLGCPIMDGNLSGLLCIALGGANSVNVHEWMKVIYGLALSIGLGFVMGWILCKLVSILFAAANRRRANVFFKYAQIASAAAMSFMHGAQDGQKFIGVLFLGVAFASGQTSVGDAGIPIWIMLLCSATMGIGTSVGGERIIKSVGQSMVKLEKYQGFSADLAGAANLLLATLTGIPVSSTHIKTCAIMGVGAVKRLSAINFGVVKDMMFTWFFTFPACGLISFVMAKLFMMFI